MKKLLKLLVLPILVLVLILVGTATASANGGGNDPGGFNLDDWQVNVPYDDYTYYVGELPEEVDEVVYIHFDPSIDVTDYKWATTSTGTYYFVPAGTLGLQLIHSIDESFNVTYYMTLYPSGTIIKESNSNDPGTWDSIQIRTLTSDTQAPIFDGQSTNFITNVDDPITESEIRSLLKAYDDVDGDISNKIQVENDGYTANRGTLGVYPITYSVADTAGNTTMIIISVHQMDVVAPTYNTSVPLIVYYRADETFVPATYLATLNFTDNYDNYSALNKQTQDNYTDNKNVVGQHTVKYTVSDTSGNATSVTVTVVVTDATGPQITGLASFTKNNDVSIKAEDLIQYLTATDDVDGNVSDEIYVLIDNYKDTKTPGQYTVTYAAKDTAGNIGTLVVTITVVDVIKPVLYITNGSFFTIDEINAMTIQDIINVLIATGQLDPGAQVTIESDSYTMNANTPGNYNITLSAKHGSETRNIDLFMNVVSSTPDEVVQGSLFREHLTEIILVSVAIGLITAIVIRRK